jgi:hypothetical protein
MLDRGSGQEGSFASSNKGPVLRSIIGGCADAIRSRQGVEAITPTAERPIAAGAGAMGHNRTLDAILVP